MTLIVRNGRVGSYIGGYQPGVLFPLVDPPAVVMGEGGFQLMPFGHLRSEAGLQSYPLIIALDGLIDIASLEEVMPGVNIEDNVYYHGYGLRPSGSDYNNNSFLYLHPFFFSKVATFNRIGANCVSPNAGGLLRVGVYTSNSDGLPTGTPLAEGELDVSASGVKTATISWLPTVNTLYWSASIVNQTDIITFDTAVPAGDGSLLRQLLGAPGVGGDPYHVLSVSGQTYGALPDLSAASFTREQSSAPAIFFRKV